MFKIKILTLPYTNRNLWWHPWVLRGFILYITQKKNLVMTLHVSLSEILSYLCVGQHIPGVEAEAAPGFTSSAGLMITGWLSSSVSSLGNTTQTHIQGWNMIYSLTELHADTNWSLRDFTKRGENRLNRREDLGEWERVMFPFKEQCHSSVYSHPTKDIIWQTQTDLRSVPLAKSTLITLQALVILVSLELWGSDVN